MGSLIKNYFAKEISVDPSSLYHITIMPCLDRRYISFCRLAFWHSINNFRKEATRKKFYDERSKSKEVDLVLTTEELLEIIIEKKVDFMSLERGIIKPLFNNYDEITKKV